jgi:F-type H+-transporting ATPase subunit delta
MITAKRVDIRYATALLEIAKEQGLEKVVYNDMLELRTLTLGSREFKNFLSNPVVKTSQKAKILRELFKNNFHQLTLDFLQLILKKARISNILNIATAFVRIYRKEYHFKTVTVYSEKELSDQQKQHLQETLSTQMPDKIIELRNLTYPDIIGGLILRYDDHLFNASIARKLRYFRRNFEFNPHQSNM